MAKTGVTVLSSLWMREDCERILSRRELIRELCEEGHSISELSECYGPSRKTIHFGTVFL
jgi:hypothetical protein